MGKQRIGKIRKYLALVSDAPDGVVSDSPLDKDQLEFNFEKNTDKESKDGED